MTISIVSQYGTDISSRNGASQLRNRVIERVPEEGAVELDFSGVRTLSDSFADELFAILVVEKGEAWFKQHVRVSNLSAPVRHTILQAVQDRLTSAAR